MSAHDLQHGRLSVLIADFDIEDIDPCPHTFNIVQSPMAYLGSHFSQFFPYSTAVAFVTGTSGLTSFTAGGFFFR